MTDLTNNELNKLLQILASCDHGCEFCVRDIFVKFIEAFPEHEDEAREFFKDKMKMDLDKVDDEMTMEKIFPNKKEKSKKK